MKTKVWITTIAGITLLSIGTTLGNHFAASESSAIASNSLNASKPILKVATGGANLRVHTAPNSGIFVTCLEDQTPVVIHQYSDDRQWALVSEQSQTNETSGQGWVRTKYLAS